MVDATIGNQAFNHVRCYIFPELSYNKANNTSFYSLEENNVEAQVELRQKLRKAPESPVVDVQKNSLLVYVLEFVGLWRVGVPCCSLVVRERD